jgi:hypothetical protein
MAPHLPGPGHRASPGADGAGGGGRRIGSIDSLRGGSGKTD